MAGLGKKTFVAGEVLLAQDVNGYLMDQSVMVFGGTAARSSAIPTPTEGMMSYRTDDDVVEVFDGSAYVGVGGAGGLTLINTTSFSAVSSVSVSDVFSATYDTYVVRSSYTGSASTFCNIRLRVAGADASAADYSRQLMDVSNNVTNFARASGETSWVNAVAHRTTGNRANLLEIHRPFDAAPTTAIKLGGSSNSTIDFANFISQHDVATSYTGFTYVVGSGTITGSISVYGYNK
jgi:hypothetical protein